MKKNMIQTIIAAGVIGLGTAAYGHDVALSPKAMSMQPRIVARASSTEIDLAHAPIAKNAKSPKGEAMVTKVVARTGAEPNLTARTPNLSPRAQEMLGRRAIRFEVAPLK